MHNQNSSEKKKVISNGIEIPSEGSLWLLALGAVGIKAWRKKREETKNKEKSKEQNG
ncbi:MAG: hypothetical protein NTX97_04600 [Bacteroidetes bacterium]|nr:hypothetical protein [Bacteroidota bacterium]